MSDILTRIKRAVLAGRFIFSEKAVLELNADGLTEMDAVESILNAVAIYKKLRSTSPMRSQAKEYLYVIHSMNLNGMPIYTKGKLLRRDGEDTYYFLISSKRGL